MELLLQKALDIGNTGWKSKHNSEPALDNGFTKSLFTMLASHVGMLVLVLAPLLLILLPDDAPARTATGDLNSWTLPPIWEIQMEFQAAGFSLTQPRPYWPSGRKPAELFLCLSFSLCHFTFPINQAILYIKAKPSLNQVGKCCLFKLSYGHQCSEGLEL